MPARIDSDEITILHARRRLAKAICADGTIESYSQAKTFDLFTQPIADLAALETLLRKIANRSDLCVVRGAIADPNRVTGVRRSLHADPETGEPPTLVDVPRRWLALDIDELPRPDWVEPEDLLACACVAIRKLPIEFRQTRFIVQGTGSHGLKPGIRLRLWTWLSRPTSGAELKYWFRRSPVDYAIFGANQLISTGAPAVLWGAFDPLPERIDVIPGHEEASVPAPDRLRPPQRRRPRAARNSIAGLVRFVANARQANRNQSLFWAACRAAEQKDIDPEDAAAQLIAAAVAAGLANCEAKATGQRLLERLAMIPPGGKTKEEWINEVREKLAEEENKKRNSGNGHEPEPDENIPEYCDDAMALAFSERHADELLYLAATGHWLWWDSHRWQKESTLKVFDLSRKLCRIKSTEYMACQKPNIKVAAGIASAATVAAIERLARADRRHARESDDFNQQHGFLNTQNGKIDLQTSARSESQREDLCTKVTVTKFDPKCETPKWTEFLDKITNNNTELKNYLQRMVGYCATGETREQMLFFLWGTGANGKGVFIKTIADVLNDYAAVASMEMFLETRNQSHPTDLAHLWGARLAYCQETDRNRKWAEAKIKAMTGGDKLTARFMRQDFFDFVPRFKIVIAGNHKPSLRGVDEAIRRRLQLVPFTVTIAKEQRNQKLAEQLMTEWPGILRWIIDGAKAWYETGLLPPAAVTDASEAYFAEQDRVAKWLDERCIVEKGRSALTAHLFANWTQWNEETNDHPGSMKAFSQALDDRGFLRGRNERGNRIFQGLCLTDEAVSSMQF